MFLQIIAIDFAIYHKKFLRN